MLQPNKSRISSIGKLSWVAQLIAHFKVENSFSILTSQNNFPSSSLSSGSRPLSGTLTSKMATFANKCLEKNNGYPIKKCIRSFSQSRVCWPTLTSTVPSICKQPTSLRRGSTSSMPKKLWRKQRQKNDDRWWQCTKYQMNIHQG